MSGEVGVVPDPPWGGPDPSPPPRTEKFLWWKIRKKYWLKINKIVFVDFLPKIWKKITSQSTGEEEILVLGGDPGTPSHLDRELGWSTKPSTKDFPSSMVILKKMIVWVLIETQLIAW